MMGGAECRGTKRMSRSAKAGTARGAGAHTVAMAQPGEETGAAAEMLCDGALLCFGILQSACACSRASPKQAAVPSIGWS
jgi:hypothetical protein